MCKTRPVDTVHLPTAAKTRNLGPATTGDAANDPTGAAEVHRLYVFDLWLTCGHITTVSLNGWYPVSVACCERLGGTVLRGCYLPYSSTVDYVQVLSETYEERRQGAPRERTQILERRPRTDDPYVPPYPWTRPSSGKLPARVGSTWLIDGAQPRSPSDT